MAAAVLLILIVVAEGRTLTALAVGGAIVYVAKVGYVRSDIEHARRRA